MVKKEQKSVKKEVIKSEKKETNKISKESTKISSDSKPIKKQTKTLSVVPKLSKRFNKLKLKPLDKIKGGIVYIGHLPKAFDEIALKKFFLQFGKIKKLRVSRSKKTGRPRGYAFL